MHKLTVHQLRALWDSFDDEAQAGEPGYFWPDDGLHLEDVHRMLNERGDGKYCAV